MKNIEDNILKIAEQYQQSLNESGFDESNSDDVRELFTDIIKDYKKMIKKCDSQGIDVNDDIKEYEELLEDGSFVEQVEAINNVQDLILNMIDLCDDVPEQIENKYIKDTVDMFK